MQNPGPAPGFLILPQFSLALHAAPIGTYRAKTANSVAV
jgi:hypothetical protein